MCLYYSFLYSQNDPLSSTVINCAKQVFDRGKFNSSYEVPCEPQTKILDDVDVKRVPSLGAGVCSNMEFHIQLLKDEVTVIIYF